MTDSWRLLAEYARSGSELAFRELVSRYFDLVYSTAVWMVDGEAHLAEDVAQTVFVDLASAARTFSPDVMLGHWLHRHTCFVAAETLRSERRRRSRKRRAAEMNALHNHLEVDLTQIRPLLDEAINQLGAKDRAAILLRFSEQHDFRSVGAALGTTEDAARTRVARALEKLHSLIKRRGVAFPPAALAAALATEAVSAAPAGPGGEDFPRRSGQSSSSQRPHAHPSQSYDYDQAQSWNYWRRDCSWRFDAFDGSASCSSRIARSAGGVLAAKAAKQSASQSDGRQSAPLQSARPSR